MEITCREWHLSLNESKCATIEFSRDSDEFLPSVSSRQDLGVVLTTNQKICSSAYQAMHLIHRNVGSTIGTKKQLYYSLVRCHLSYCSQLWRPMLLKDIVKLEKVYRRSTKFITGDYVSDYKTRLLSLHNYVAFEVLVGNSRHNVCG